MNTPFCKMFSQILTQSTLKGFIYLFIYLKNIYTVLKTSTFNTIYIQNLLSMFDLFQKVKNL